MANKSATIAIDMTFTGSGGTTVTAPRKSIAVPYQSFNQGMIDVPALAAKDTEYDIPFGAVETSATAVRIDNNTDVRICIKINGAAAVSHAIQPGGSQVIAAPTEDAGTVPDPLTSMSAVLGEAETAAGTIDYWVFGDPT